MWIDSEGQVACLLGRSAMVKIDVYTLTGKVIFCVESIVRWIEMVVAPGIFLKDLTDSISLKHNDTLRRLAFLDAASP